MIIVVSLCTYFKLPIYPAVAISYVHNPFTLPFIIAASTKIGLALMHKSIDIQHINLNEISIHWLLTTGEDIAVPFLIGGNLLAIATGLVVYPISYTIYKKYQTRKQAL